VTTTNAIYRCEELEDSVSVYDVIVEENVTAAAPDNVYLEILSDETQEGTKPPPPMPRTEVNSEEQDRDGYEGLKDKKPENVYLQLIGEETPGCDRLAKAEDEVRDTKTPYRDQEADTKL